MIINGKEIANRALIHVREGIEKLSRTPKIRVIIAGENPAIESFVRIKRARAKEVGILFEIQRFSESVSTKEIIDAVSSGNEDVLIVQLPLPKHVDTTAVLSTIPTDKDADVLSPTAYSMFEKNVSEALIPPVVFAVREVLKTNDIQISGRRVLVVGNGILVGKPVARYFINEGACVDVVSLEKGSLSDMLPRADIIVSGAGVPNLITPEHIKDGVILIDAGTSEAGGVIVGDIDFACAEKASLLTPVPGGIGPLTVAGLLQNVLTLAMRKFA